jgi:MHS family proline/betaine transporter-like MFS transporter
MELNMTEQAFNPSTITVGKTVVPTSNGRAKAVTAGVIGSVLEWYDFTIYGFLVPVMAPLFFPNVSPAIAILSSFGVLGVGFLARPGGAILFGILGDRLGRRLSLAIAMIVMGLATVAMGLLPTFAMVGFLAPVLLVLLRLIQGVSTGGEWGGGAAFVIEYAPNTKRGLYGGLHVVGVVIGILLGSMTVLLIRSQVGAEDMSSFGWRLPFFLGALTAILGIIIRFRIAETPIFNEARTEAQTTTAPLRAAFSTNFGAVAMAFGVTVLQAINSWVLLIWIVTFLTTTVGLPYSTALFVNSIGLVVMLICLPLFGALSDRLGRKRVMLTAAILMLILIIPVFWGMRSGSLGLVIFSYCAVIACHTLYAAPQVAMLVELFPTSTRVTGLSIGYNISQTIFGGFAPFIASLLIALTGDPTAAAWYVMAGALVSTLVLLRMKETAFSPLR